MFEPGAELSKRMKRWEMAVKFLNFDFLLTVR